MHHVPSAEAYEPVSSIILGRLSISLQAVHDELLPKNPEVEIERLTDLATILVEVRKGGRVHGRKITLIAFLHLIQE
jgi:hypothetical protein